MVDTAMVTVTYNGEDQAMSYEAHTAVMHLLVHARKLFQCSQPERLALFTEHGVEVPACKLARDIISPGDLLVLRPRALP